MFGHRHPQPGPADGRHRHFIVMYPCSYNPDNLSLMALTLSVGFVVDDAIVMLKTSSATWKWASADAGCP
jgi:Cu/Ag efflux pump CusA